MVFIIAVRSRSDVTFSMIATTSQRAVLIQPGVPQNHFVSQGRTEFFQFYPDDDEDIGISVTARSGDPDLLVSSYYANPNCVAGVSTYDVRCSNYTWISRMYSTDQIIISKVHEITLIRVDLFVFQYFRLSEKLKIKIRN